MLTQFYFFEERGYRLVEWPLGHLLSATGAAILSFILFHINSIFFTHGSDDNDRLFSSTDWRFDSFYVLNKKIITQIRRNNHDWKRRVWEREKGGKRGKLGDRDGTLVGQ